MDWFDFSPVAAGVATAFYPSPLNAGEDQALAQMAHDQATHYGNDFGPDHGGIGFGTGVDPGAGSSDSIG